MRKDIVFLAWFALVFFSSLLLSGQEKEKTVPVLIYTESRLPYHEEGDQIVPPSPSGKHKAEAGEGKRLLNLLYATVSSYSRFLGRGDNVPAPSLCEVKIQQNPADEKIYIQLKINPDVYWRLPYEDPKNRVIHQDILYTLDYLRNWKSENRQRALGAFFSDNIEIKTAGVDQELIWIAMNSSMQGPNFPKMDEWGVRAFFSTFHLIPTPRLKNPQGGGPYIFKTLDRTRKEIVLEENPLSFQWKEALPQAPRKIVLKELTDRLQKLVSGEVDLVPEIGATALFRTDLQNEFQILYSPASSFYYIAFHKNPDAQSMEHLLEEEELKKMANGLSWFSLLKRAYEGVDSETKHAIRNNNFNKDAEVLDGPFDSSSPIELVYDENSEQEEEKRTERIREEQVYVAKSCMRSSSDARGLMEHPKIQRALGMKRWSIIYQDFSKFSPELKDIADGFAAKLQMLGISPNQIDVHGVRSLNQWRYRIQNGMFDFIVSHFDYGQDYDISDFIMPGGSSNYVSFSSRVAIRHFEEFQKTQDPGRRIASLTMLHKIVRDEFPGVFILAPVKFAVYNQKRIKRLYTDDNFFFSRLHLWQIDANDEVQK